MHIVLLGDSIFDNSVYVKKNKDFFTYFKNIMPEIVLTSFLAIDGSKIKDLKKQIEKIPHGTTHAVVSIGGNDALSNIDMLNISVKNTGEALCIFNDRINNFENSYFYTIGELCKKVPNITLCTIYNGCFSEDMSKITQTALRMFNDCIYKTANKLSLNVIDLRLICNTPQDYANAIEPSEIGGEKIAKAISQMLLDF
jgi:hypothetical protein